MKIEIKNWSATDYSFLLNNTNGRISDDFKFYEFDSSTDYQIMIDYLECASDGGELGSIDVKRDEDDTRSKLG
jgi:hypothetical protein